MHERAREKRDPESISFVIAQTTIKIMEAGLKNSRYKVGLLSGGGGIAFV